MPKPNTKGISVHVDAELHAEIRAYLEAQEMTMSEFVALAARDELHPRAPDLDPELQAEVMAYLEDSNITVDEFIALAIQNELHPLIPGIDDALEAEIQAYLEENEMDIGDFIANAAQNELHPKTHEPEVNRMGKEPTRTLAFQVPESLFERVKEYLERNNMTQKAFVIGLIEDELDRDEELLRKQQEDTQAAEEESQNEDLSEDGEAPVSEDDPEAEQGDEPEETAAVGDFEGGSDEQDEDEVEQGSPEDEPDEMPDYEDEPGETAEEETGSDFPDELPEPDSEQDFAEIEDGGFPEEVEQDESLSEDGEALVSEDGPDVGHGDEPEETADVGDFEGGSDEQDEDELEQDEPPDTAGDEEEISDLHEDYPDRGYVEGELGAAVEIAPMPDFGEEDGPAFPEPDDEEDQDYGMSMGY